MIFSDTHCHIYSEQFDDDIDQIVAQAQSDGVHRFFLPNIDQQYIDRLHKLTDEHPKSMFPMMGLHPCSVKSDFEDQLMVMEELLKKPARKYYGVGEIGIDLYWDKTHLEEQKEAFRIQAQWAKDLQLPIIIHVRDAFPEIFELMDEVYDDQLSGIFHCFTGGDAEAEKVQTYPNFLMGIGGVVTFKNSGLDAVVRNIPLDKLVLETDSPYLTPHPHRGKRNEPSYLLYVAEKVAQIHGISLEELSTITERNTNRIFKISN